MKAIIYKTYGPADVLHITEVEKPKPKKNEILIKIRATEATKADCELRSLKFPVKWFAFPLRIAFGFFKPRKQILGSYFAGEVEELGSKVTKFKPGDAIFGTTNFRFGAYGEYLCLPESYTLVPKPNNMSFEEAAAVPLGGLNAIHFMRKAKIKHGEKVLINGAGGSIGTFAVQIAKAMGAEVTAVDSGIKEKMLLGIGTDHFIDYTKEDFTESGKTYDVIFNMVVGMPYAKIIRLLNSKGRYLLGNPRISDMLRSVWTPLVTGKSIIFAFAEEKEEELLDLKEMIENSQIKSVIYKVYSMEQVVEAHRMVETEQRVGIVVLSIKNS